jgi:REP element-mobilizing transposase RayT
VHSNAIRSSVRSRESALRLRREGLRGQIWQRGYFDRVIRNDRELDALREYIQNNPLALEIKYLELT